MLRLTPFLCSLFLVITPLFSFSQSVELAISRQAYHQLHIINPDESPSISQLLDSLHIRREFTSVCPVNGNPSLILKNEGSAQHLKPPQHPLHPWEPKTWVQIGETSSWRGVCPGDSVEIVYSPSINRVNCGPIPDSPPWPSANINAPNQWWIEAESTLGTTSGSVYTLLGDDQIFDKPIIIVEGFDFAPGGNLEEYRHGKFGWQSLWGCDTYSFPGTAGYPIMLDSLISEGYDIVFIDFRHGTQSIERKSILVQHVINLCNTYKTEDNALVVVGASMGGVVARHALRSMEMNGESHCTRLYISIDAPHRGANISPGLLGIVSLLSEVSSEAAIFNVGLQSPAANQLLLTSPSGSEDHIDAMNLLQNMGMPESTINVAIANSNPEVSLQLEDSPLLNWTECWWWLGSAHLLANRYPEGNNDVAISASCSLPVDFIPFNGTPIWYDNEIFSYYPSIDYDIEPASLGHHMGALVDAINASGFLSISNDQYQPTSGFIPTFSALNYNPNSITSQPYFDDWHIAPIGSAPEEHVALTAFHRQLVLNHILLGDDSPSEELGYDFNQEVFTFGYQSPYAHLIKNTRVFDGGKILIGEDNSILSSNSDFNVRTYNCGAYIEINNGGKLILGTNSGLSPGVLSLEANSILSCLQGSDVHINAGSTLKVRSGSILIIDNSELHIEAEGKLIIESGGEILLKNNAQIVLHGSDSEIVWAGQIVVDENSEAQITVLDEAMSFINIQGITSSLNVQSGSNFEINGHNYLEIGLNEESVWTLNGTGLINLTNLNLHLVEGAIIYQHLKAHITACDIYGSNFAQWSGNERLRIQDSYWSRISLLMLNPYDNPEVSGCIALSNNISDSEWILENTGFNISSCEWVSSTFTSTEHLGPSHFNQNRIEGVYDLSTPIISMINGGHVNIQSNMFTEGVAGLYLEGAQTTLSCNQFNGWDYAVTLKGKCTTCMDPSGGGGSNRFDSNRIHMMFECSPPPSLDKGKNRFGSFGLNSFYGTLDWNCGDNWIIVGNNWSQFSSYPIWGGILPSTQLTSCEENCIESTLYVEVVLPDATVEICTEDKPTNTFIKMEYNQLITSDILGRQINIEQENTYLSPGIYFKKGIDNRFNKIIKFE